MHLEVNGTTRAVRAETLADLVAELGLDAACVATALDGRFVPREARAATPLRAGAAIEVLAPMQGG